MKAAADDIKCVFDELEYRCYLVTSWDGGIANGGTNSAIIVGLCESHMLPVGRLTDLPAAAIPNFDIRLL